MAAKKPRLTHVKQRRAIAQATSDLAAQKNEPPKSFDLVRAVSDIGDVLRIQPQFTGHLESIAQAMAVVAEHVANIGDIRPPGAIDTSALAVKIDGLEAEVKGILSRPPRLAGSMTTAEKRIDALESKYNALHTDMMAVLKRLGAVESRAGNLETFTGKVEGGAPAPIDAMTEISEPPKRKRGRPSNAELAARAAAAQADKVVNPPVVQSTEAAQAQAAAAVEGMKSGDAMAVHNPAPTTDPIRPLGSAPGAAALEAVKEMNTAAKSLEQEEAEIREYIETNPGTKVSDVLKKFKVSFNRATSYIEAWGKPPTVVPAGTGIDMTPPEGKTVVVPVVPAAQATVDVTPAKATSIPSLDDVRATAITFAGKHGKEKLGALIAKYGAGKLSDVKEEQRAAFHTELLAGV